MIEYLFASTVFLALILLGTNLASEAKSGMWFSQKKVGPTYWGAYSCANAVDSPAEQLIDLPKPSRCIDPAYGGSTYASGKAVKSAKG